MGREWLSLFEHLEFIALLFEPEDAEWQCGFQLVDGLERVVESDDGAVADVAANVVEDIVGGHPLGVVARDDIPHDDFVAAAKECILWYAHPAVGWPEEVATDVSIGFFDVVAVFVQGMAEAADVVVCVVSDLMTIIDDLLIEFGVFTDVVADHEEGGVYAMLLEDLQDEWCGLGDWAVVEGEVDCTFATVHSPECLWVEPAEIDGGLLYDHLSLNFLLVG